MPRRNHQHVGRPGQTAERIMGHPLHVEGNIDGHFAFVFKADAALVQNLGGHVHLGGAFADRIAEGREGQERHPGFKAKAPRDHRAAFGNVGKVVFIGPFLHQRIADQHDPTLVQHRRDANRAIFGAGVEDVVDQFQHMRGLARHARNQPVAVPMRQHQRRKNVTVAGGKLVDILTVEALTLKPPIQQIAVGIEVPGIRSIDDFQFAHRIAKADGFQLFLHILIAADDQRLALPRTLPGHRRAQDPRIVAFGEDHPRLRLPGTRMDALQDRRGRVHPGLQAQFIGGHVDDRPPRHTRRHAGLGHRGRDHMDQPRVEGRRNDVVAPERKLAAIGHRHFVRDILARQFGQGARAGDLHFVIDRTGMDIQRTAEQIRKTKNIVHLVGIIAAPRRHDGIGTDGVSFLRGDFRVWIGHREDHRIVAHAGDHLGRHRALGRHTKEHVRAHHRLFQRASIGPGGMGRFPLVHAFGATLIDHALGVAHDAIVVLGAHRLQKLKTGDPRRAGTIEDDLHVADLLAGNLQRVDQTGGTDHRRAMLVVMEHRNVHDFLQALFDDETLGRLDVFKIDAPEGRRHQPHGLNDLVGVFGIQLDVDGVHVGEPLEKDGFPLHHRFRGQRAQIAKTQDRGAVRHDGDHVALDGIIIGGFRTFRDRIHRHGHAGTVGQRQVALGRHRFRGLDFIFSRLGNNVIA